MSIETQTFDDLTLAMQFLDKLALQENDFIFRGHTQEHFKLRTTLHRHRKIPHESWSSDIDEMIDQFRVGLTKLNIMPFQSESRMDWLEYARHHGVPTPVLDFTYSPYIALFFAFNGVRNSYDAKKDEYAVIYALNIASIAWLWATLFQDPKQKYDDVMKSYNQFLYPQGELFQKGFPDMWLQFIPFPGKFNTRMHRQQGTLLFDTLDYPRLGAGNLDELIEKHKEPDTALPSGSVEKGRPALYKILVNKRCVSDVFSRLELMGINGGALYGNADGVSQDVVNAYNYSTKTFYLRDTRFPAPDVR